MLYSRHFSLSWFVACMWSVVEYLLLNPACSPDWFSSSFFSGLLVIICVNSLYIFDVNYTTFVVDKQSGLWTTNCHHLTGYPCYALHPSLFWNKIIRIFKRESIKKTILHCWFLHAQYKHIGCIIISKPNLSSRVGIISRCRCFGSIWRR